MIHSIYTVKFFPSSQLAERRALIEGNTGQNL